MISEVLVATDESDMIQSPTGALGTNVSCGSQKPKRKYVRKQKTVDTPVVPDVVPDVVHEVVPEVVLEVVPDVVPDVAKKPRSDKQIAAFSKMREARLKKQSELESLKILAKHQADLEKEQAAISKLEDKIIKKKAARKTRAKSPALADVPPSTFQVVSDTQKVAQDNLKLPTPKPILFR